MDNATNYLSVFFILTAAMQYNLLRLGVTRISTDVVVNDDESMGISRNIKNATNDHKRAIYYVDMYINYFQMAYQLYVAVNVLSVCVILYLFVLVIIKNDEYKKIGFDMENKFFLDERQYFLCDSKFGKAFCAGVELVWHLLRWATIDRPERAVGF